MTKKHTWKHSSWQTKKFKGNYELADMISTENYYGLLSGLSVYVVTDIDHREKLDSLAHGIVDGGKEMADPILELLGSSTEILKGNKFGITMLPIVSASERLVVRLGAEEALFLVHAIKCLHVYKSSSKIDAWSHLASGSYEPICYVTADNLLDEFTLKSPRFLYRYLAYFHYRSKGWLSRSGLQFGSDFVLYQYHPKVVHSQFAVIVVATTVEPTKKTIKVIDHRQSMGTQGFRLFKGIQLTDRKLLWSEVRAVSRLQTQVTKRLIFCYVALINRTHVIPRYDGSSICHIASSSTLNKSSVDVLSECKSTIDVLERALVEEFIIGRWNPGKTQA